MCACVHAMVPPHEKHLPTPLLIEVMLGLILLNRLHNYCHCIILLSASCNDGDVRVVGGDSEREGRLEVCFNQRWGTVNGDGWSSVDTQVACRQLGYETSGKWR